MNALVDSNHIKTSHVIFVRWFTTRGYLPPRCTVRCWMQLRLLKIKNLFGLGNNSDLNSSAKRHRRWVWR